MQLNKCGKMTFWLPGLCLPVLLTNTTQLLQIIVIVATVAFVVLNSVIPESEGPLTIARYSHHNLCFMSVTKKKSEKGH